MKLRAPRTLQGKLLGVVLLTTLISLLAALGAMVAYDLRSYHQSAVADMSTQAELVGQATSAALSFDDRKVAGENLQLLRIRRQVRAAAVYDAHGRIFATYQAAGGGPEFPPHPEAEGVKVVGRELTLFRRVVDNSETIGTVYLRADYELNERLVSYAEIALAVLAAAMAIAFVLSLRLQRVVMRPVREISQIAQAVIERKDYSQRARPSGDDEVGLLAASFNDMLAEIERRTQENETALREVAREIAERRQAQQETIQLNRQLEGRVQERTAALEASNRDLTRATDAAEHANRAKSEFISSMSHELRTPLNAILGFGQLLVTESLPLTLDKRVEYTRHILKAGHHLLNLINEILDLAKIESSNLMLSLEPVLLSDILHECRTMIEPSAQQRGIRLLFAGTGALSVTADRTRLKQVFLNLLSNAVKYNRNEGTVFVECAAVSPERIRITVRDTGAGLRAEQVRALFQPFNRLGQEASAIEGSGIGLVVTRRLVELMGGEIEADSTPGVGTVFTVEMDASAPPAGADIEGSTPALAVGQSSPPVDKPLLLYVEDNPANQKLFDEIMGLRGDLRHLMAPDAQIGLELARAHRPRVIVMDINLPGLGGRDAQALLRKDPRTAGIPVIALTANAMPRDRAQAMAEGFFDYLTKPIDVGRLLQAIDSALLSGPGGDSGA